MLGGRVGGKQLLDRVRGLARESEQMRENMGWDKRKKGKKLIPTCFVAITESKAY